MSNSGTFALVHAILKISAKVLKSPIYALFDCLNRAVVVGFFKAFISPLVACVTTSSEDMYDMLQGLRNK